MIRIEKVEIYGWEHAIRGMRNAKNSWDRSDSVIDEPLAHCEDCPYDRNTCDDYSHCINIGPNDHKLMMQLASGGPVHAKYRRMITVYLDITAPLYWWKEFDTYKIGTVANSCSTMHKIHDKEFTLDDFSHEHLIKDQPVPGKIISANASLSVQIYILNAYRDLYNSAKQQDHETDDEFKERKKLYWWQMIQLLPSSYNQKRTIMLNYEVLVGIYKWRKDHKLDEWREFCKWIESLPYSELITGAKGTE